MKGDFLISDRGDFVQPLLLWFRRTARDLPWRRTYDPYHVWLSEIMLQQTQMDRGVVYFNRWLARFPSVRAVAEADLQEILKYWEGLGYYARARNLHKAAKVIAGELRGQVPGDYQQLLALPGIGPYTAAAIASVAGNQDVAVVDANVMRVFARLFDLALPLRELETKKRIAAMARDFLPSGRARLYNQALMDLGGLVCLPKNPRCAVLPDRLFLQSPTAGDGCRKAGDRPWQENRHRAKGGGDHPPRTSESLSSSGQRTAVWGGLWEFPGGELQGGVAGEGSGSAHPVRDRLCRQGGGTVNNGSAPLHPLQDRPAGLFLRVGRCKQPGNSPFGHRLPVAVPGRT